MDAEVTNTLRRHAPRAAGSDQVSARRALRRLAAMRLEALAAPALAGTGAGASSTS